MYSRLALVALALAVLAVPAIVLAGGADGADGGPETAAATVDTPNGSAIELEPATGPGTNGQYANVTDDELALSFDDLNENATTTADDVFEIGVTAASPATISVEDDASGVAFYWGDDPTASAADPRTVQPGKNVSVGVRADSVGAIDGGNFTVIAEQAESGGGDSGGGFVPPGSGDEDGDGALTVTSAAVDPAALAPGETATVTATVSNAGSTAATDVVELAVNGTVVDRTTVTVGAESNETVTFERTFQQPGTFALSVGGVDAGTVSVTAPTTGNESTAGGFRVANVSLSPAVIQPGEATTITANVTNRGESTGTFRAELSVGGVVVEERAVRVAPGATERVAFERSFDRRGGYEVAVSGVAAESGSLRVESATTTSMRRYGSEYGWLLGAATIPTLGGAFVAARRRGRFLED